MRRDSSDPVRTPLPPQVRVFVRDWLSSNNVLLRGDDGHALIDTGYHLHADLLLRLLGSSGGIGDEPLALLVNTHCHCDHIGGNAAVIERYAGRGCRVLVPLGEVPILEPWNPGGEWLSGPDQDAPFFRHDEAILPGSVHRWGDLDWKALLAPGHDMGALMFWNAEHGILVTGDALWRNGFGFVVPAELDPACLPATRETLERIAALPVRVVIPGHGEPFDDVGPALERAFSRIDALERDPVRNARHIMKALLVFSLLARRRMRIAEIPAYCESIAIFGALNRMFLGLESGALADLLVRELQAGLVIRRDGEAIVPA